MLCEQTDVAETGPPKSGSTLTFRKMTIDKLLEGDLQKKISEGRMECDAIFHHSKISFLEKK